MLPVPEGLDPAWEFPWCTGFRPSSPRHTCMAFPACRDMPWEILGHLSVSRVSQGSPLTETHPRIFRSMSQQSLHKSWRPRTQGIPSTLCLHAKTQGLVSPPWDLCWVYANPFFMKRHESDQSWQRGIKLPGTQGIPSTLCPCARTCTELC